MKKFTFLIFTACLLATNVAFAQTDSSSNYFISKEKQLDFLNAEAQRLDIPLEEVEGYKSFARWDGFYYKRHDGNGDMNSYVDALADFYENNNKSSGNVVPEWDYIGHDTLTGRHNGQFFHSEGQQGWINRIWVNPADSTHILAGTHHAGIWLTYDHGNYWEPITDNEPMIQGVSSLEVDLETNKIYFCSRNDPSGKSGYSTGLYSTTDDGLTWECNKVKVNGEDLYPTANQHKSLVKWLIHPVHKDTMFLLTNSMFLRSFDGGGNWETLIDSSSSSSYDWNNYFGFKDMEFDQNDLSTLYLSGVHVFKVANYGGTIGDITDITPHITQYTQQSDTNRRKIFMGQNDNFPDKIWFAIWAAYGPDNLAVLNISTNTTDSLYGATSFLDSYKMQCEVTANGNTIFIGGLAAKQFSNGQIELIYKDDYVNSNFVHVDIRDAQYININGRDKLFVGCDGGVFTCDYSNAIDDWQWTYITNDGTNGIRNSELRGFACSRSETDILYTGFQDMHKAARHDGEWFTFGDGDGGPGIISPHDPYLLISSSSSGGTAPAGVRKSFNGGIDNDIELEPVNKAGLMGLAFHPTDENILYMGDKKKLRKYNNIYDNIIFEDIHTIDPDSYKFDLSIREVETNINYPELVYCSTDRYLPGYWGIPDEYAKALYMSVLGGEETNDISEYIIDGLEGGMITGIASNPYAPWEIWLSFGTTAYDDGEPQKKKKVYVLYYNPFDPGSATFTPKADSLPKNLPVNDIMFDSRTGVLYLANDVGIYYFNKTGDYWERINNNLPPVLCEFIRLNPAINKLRIGTYGRGVWETDIPCIYSPDEPIVISTGETWPDAMMLDTDIIIEDDGHLTILDTVYLPKGASIIVKPGGKLTIDGGKLTNLCQGKLWRGVQVWGIPTTMVNQGYLLMNNATIENSEVAIRNYSPDETDKQGGKVRAENSVFRNNGIAVDFRDYEYNGLTRFDDCLFEADGDYFEEAVIAFVELQNTGSYIRFKNCIFKNLEGNYKGIGINSSNGTIFLYGNNGLFENLQYGIKMTGFGTTLGSVIKQSTFTDNHRAIYISGINEMEITENTLNVAPSGSGPFGIETYGAYLNSCTGYTLQQNHFTSFDSTNMGTVGLYINNSGGDDNMVNDNIFDHLIHATVAYGQNSAFGPFSDDKGLCYKCNEFTNNNFDIAVVSGKPGYGIKPTQGSSANEADAPAGNRFSWTGPEGTPTDINNDATHITYWHHVSNEAPLKPEYYTEATVTLKANVDAIWSEEGSCPQSVGGGGGGGDGDDGESGLLEEMTINSLKADSIQNILDVLVDGGDTEATELTVETSYPPESYTVYNDLMGKSPYLSGEVLDAAIEKDDVLPNVMIRDVMVANPQSAKEDELIDKLDERAEPMPDYMLAQILQGRSLVGYMEELYSQKSYYGQKRALAFNGLVKLYQQDSTLQQTDIVDSLIALFNSEDKLAAKYRLAMLHFEKGTYADGQNILNDIPNSFALSDGQNMEHGYFTDFYQIIVDAAQSGENLTEGEIADLEIIIGAEAGLASTYTRNLLIMVDGMEYIEPVILPDFTKSASAEAEYNELMKILEEHHYLKVFPNPAKDYVVIGYELEMVYENAQIMVYDSKGILQQTLQAKNIKDQVVVDTKQLPTGIYIVGLYVNGKEMESIKFTIVK